MIRFVVAIQYRHRLPLAENRSYAVDYYASIQVVNPLHHQNLGILNLGGEHRVIG
jgi:hypothetical protein